MRNLSYGRRFCPAAGAVPLAPSPAPPPPPPTPRRPCVAQARRAASSSACRCRSLASPASSEVRARNLPAFPSMKATLLRASSPLSSPPPAAPSRLPSLPSPWLPERSPRGFHAFRTDGRARLPLYRFCPGSILLRRLQQMKMRQSRAGLAGQQQPVLTPAAAAAAAAAAAETSDGDAGVSAQRGGDPCPGCARGPNLYACAAGGRAVCRCTVPAFARSSALWPAPQGVDWYAVVPSLPSLPPPCPPPGIVADSERVVLQKEPASITADSSRPAGPSGAPGGRGRISPPGTPGMAGCAPITSSLRERPPPSKHSPQGRRPAGGRRNARPIIRNFRRKAPMARMRPGRAAFGRLRPAHAAAGAHHGGLGAHKRHVPPLAALIRPINRAPPMTKTDTSYEEDYGKYMPGEDVIAVTYDSVDEAEEAILRRVLGE